MNPEISYYVFAIIAVILAGLAKGGFAGVGALAMPVMALGVDPVRGAAILLPILILQDAVSVWVYRRSWDGAILKVMLPGAAIGILLAHAGSPPFQMWVLPKRLPRDMLVGTTALAFAAMTWMKMPAYAALGQFTRANLMATAMLVPVAVVSTLAGVALVRRVDPARFYTLIYGLMVLLGIKLVADALMA